MDFTQRSPDRRVRVSHQCTTGEATKGPRTKPWTPRQQKVKTNQSVTTEVGRMHEEFWKLSEQRIFRKENDQLRQMWFTGIVR